MMGPRKMTRSQRRLMAGVQNSFNEGSMESKSQDHSCEANLAQLADSPAAEQAISPNTTDNFNLEVPAGALLKIDENPVLPEGSSNHLNGDSFIGEDDCPTRVMRCALPARRRGSPCPTSSSTSQQRASGSDEPIPARIMRCTSSSRSLRCPSPAASSSGLSNSAVLPAQTMRYPVAPSCVLRCEKAKYHKPTQATPFWPNTVPTLSSSYQDCVLMSYPSASTSSSSQSNIQITEPALPESGVGKRVKVDHSKDSNFNECKKTESESPDSEGCSSSALNPTPVSLPSALKCRSGRASYSLRALKIIPLYNENGFGSISHFERIEEKANADVLETDNNEQISSCETEIENTHINMLPDEILCMIFSYIPHLELLRSCSTVCHRWLTLVKTPFLWQTLNFCGQDTSIETVCGFIKLSPILKSITIKDRSDVDTILPLLHQQCKRLENVNLVRCRSGSQRTLKAKSLYPFLRKGHLYSLNLKGTDYKSRKFYQRLSFMPNLTKLNISCSRSISPHILNEIAELTTLRVFKNKWHSDSIYHGPKSMTIQLPGKIDDWAHAYNKLFQNVGVSLTTLEFYAAGISDTALSGLVVCKTLKKLSVYNANLFAGESMAAVGSLSELKELLIHNAVLSTGDVVSACQTGNLSKLKCLHLNHSIPTCSPDITADDCLTTIAEKCQQLQHLSFTKCRDLTDDGVRSVLTLCSKLKSLDLHGGIGISGQSFLLIPQKNTHLKLLVVEEGCSEEKSIITKQLMEKHGITVHTTSTWKHRGKSYYL